MFSGAGGGIPGAKGDIAGIAGPIGTGGIAGPRLSGGNPAPSDGVIGVELTEHIEDVLIPVASWAAGGFV